MAIDYHVQFPAKKPKKKEFESVVRHFFDGGAEEIKWNQRLLCIRLPGVASNPFTEVSGLGRFPFDGGERWITAEMSGTQLTVTIRGSDDYTMVLAKGLAAVFARYWEGTIGDDEEE